jgi:hypothetical protein
MEATEPAYSEQPRHADPSRPRNGLGVAALIIGAASLVAGLSFLCSRSRCWAGWWAPSSGSSRSPAAGPGARGLAHSDPI